MGIRMTATFANYIRISVALSSSARLFWGLRARATQILVVKSQVTPIHQVYLRKSLTENNQILWATTWISNH